MIVERKYQVFVCSTYTDLLDARQVLVKALLGNGMIPVGMELDPAGYAEHWKALQTLINDCDYFLILLGGRYGALSPMGLSYTHREFTYAVTRGKPVLALLHDNPDLLPAVAREPTKEGQVRLNDFRKLLQEKSSLYRFWNSPQDLSDSVRRALPPLIKSFPAPGWVKAGQVADLASQREITDLRKRIAELETEKEERGVGYRPPIESLARGQDVLVIEFSCNAYVKGDCKVAGARTAMTWDQIFACVGPQMMNEVSEEAMRGALEERIAESALADVQKLLPKAHAVRNVVISTNSFNQIKIHLRALGLIKKCRGVANGELTWQLTVQGDGAMTSLLAQSRGR